MSDSQLEALASDRAAARNASFDVEERAGGTFLAAYTEPSPLADEGEEVVILNSAESRDRRSAIIALLVQGDLFES